MSFGLEQRVAVQLRWRDMDMLGHLNQSVYHELLEEGRAAVMTELMRRARNEVYGSYVLVHVDLDTTPRFARTTAKSRSWWR